MRHTRHVQEAVRRVKEGVIGPVGLMCCYFNFSSLRETPPRPDSMSEMVYQLRNPYHFQWLSGDYICRRGGALLRPGPMAARQPAGDGPGARRPAGLSAQLPGRHVRSHHRRIHLRDRQSCLRKRGRCPAAGYSRPFRRTDRKVGPMCSAGESMASRRGMRGVEPNSYQVEHDLLIEAIRGDKPYNDVDRAATATLVAIMGRMASYSGQEITWQQVLDTKTRLGPQTYAFDAAPPVMPDKTGLSGAHARRDQAVLKPRLDPARALRIRDVDFLLVLRRESGHITVEQVDRHLARPPF